MADKLRIGFIGAGANTTLRHLPGLAELDDVEFVAVSNRSLDSGHRVADKFGIDRVTDNPATVLGAPDIDAIFIGTWPYRHRDFVVRALEAGKHVLCEARMALNVGEARDMLKAARAHPGQVAQLVPAPFDFRSWRTIRRLVGDGTLGDIREVHVTSLNGNALGEAPLHWREQQRYSGTNTMIFGILAEMVHRWFGATEVVQADASIFVRERTDAETGRATTVDVPDSLGVLARMSNGARATYRLSTVAANPLDPAGITIHGSRATLQWRMDDTMALAPLGGAPAPLAPDPGTEGSWTVERDFVTSIREGTPVELTSFEDGVEYMRLTEAVWRSWNESRAIRLDEI